MTLVLIFNYLSNKYIFFSLNLQVKSALTIPSPFPFLALLYFPEVITRIGLVLNSSPQQFIYT